MTSDCSCSGERRRLRSRSSSRLLATAHAVEPQMILNEVEDKFAVTTRHPDETNSHRVIGGALSGAFCLQPRDLEGNPEGETIGRNQEEPRSVFRTKRLFATDEGAPGADVPGVPHGGPPFGHDDSRPIYDHSRVTPSFLLIRHDQISPLQGSPISLKWEEQKTGAHDRQFRQTALALRSVLALSPPHAEIEPEPQPLDPSTSLCRTNPRGTPAAS